MSAIAGVVYIFPTFNSQDANTRLTVPRAFTRPASRRGKATEREASPKRTDYAALDPDDKRKQGFFPMMTIHGCVIIGW